MLNCPPRWTLARILKWKEKQCDATEPLSISICIVVTAATHTKEEEKNCNIHVASF